MAMDDRRQDEAISASWETTWNESFQPFCPENDCCQGRDLEAYTAQSMCWPSAEKGLKCFHFQKLESEKLKLGCNGIHQDWGSLIIYVEKKDPTKDSIFIPEVS